MLLNLFLGSIFVSFAISQETCVNSVTKSSIGGVCSKQIIFEEHFNDLDLNKWRNTIKISSLEDEEFVVYDNKPKNIYIKDGKLFIQPTLMPDDNVANGHIDFKVCTGRYGTSDCNLRSVSYNILPPVESAQISTKTFHFKYGIVEIRAKLPSGDWIYPQLWLESNFKEYGQFFNSGKIIIATVHGNQELVAATGADISNKVLKSGLVLGIDQKVYAKSAFLKNKKKWTDGFHNFTFIWKPDLLKVIVDNEEAEFYNSKSAPLVSEFNYTAKEKQDVWGSSTPVAPFDKHFRITLGVAVGGIREFPDGCTTQNLHMKPWKNVGSVKRLLNFWNDRSNWISTWANEESALQVDYVKVTAI